MSCDYSRRVHELLLCRGDSLLPPSCLVPRISWTLLRRELGTKQKQNKRGVCFHWKMKIDHRLIIFHFSEKIKIRHRFSFFHFSMSRRKWKWNIDPNVHALSIIFHICRISHQVLMWHRQIWKVFFTYPSLSVQRKYVRGKNTRGGLRIWKGWGCSSEILN